MVVNRDDELTAPGDDEKATDLSMNRWALFIVVGGIGAYLVISGIVGILGKG